MKEVTSSWSIFIQLRTDVSEKIADVFTVADLSVAHQIAAKPTAYFTNCMRHISEEGHCDIHHRDKFQFPIKKAMPSLRINIFTMHAPARKPDSLSTRQETNNLSSPA